MVGEPEATRALLRYYEEQPYNVTLVYITGRYLDSALSLIKEAQIPIPDILITDVGTEIYEGPSFSPMHNWTEKMEQNWDPVQISAIANQIEGLLPQQIPFKHRLSYTINSISPVLELEERLNQKNIKYKVIVSSGRDVDILPESGGKGEALRFLLQTKKWEDAKVLVAGDSGNDLEMITLGYPAVIVGNAQKELLDVEKSPMIYIAAKHCAGGIQEAWEYFYKQT